MVHLRPTLTETNNTGCGINALSNNTTEKNNIGLGLNARANFTKGSNNIDIGSVGVGRESEKIDIGKQGTQNGTFIDGISGVTGTQVVVNSTGN